MSFTAFETGPQRVPADSATVMSKALTESTLREHFAELRRALVAGIDTQTDRITAEVRALLLESLPPPAPPPVPADPEPPPAATPWAWVVAGVALAIALASSALWWRSEKLLEQLEAEVRQLHTQQASPAVATASSLRSTAAAASTAVTSTATDSKPLIVPVPYGGEPLGGARLEAIRQQLHQLARQQVKGVAEIRTFAGRFCLVGNAVEGYSPAPDELLVSRCDLVGNPSDDALAASQRTPLALANLIGEIRSTTHGALEVQVSAGDPANVLVPYPAATSYLNAGEWNRAAGANNRIEIRVR
jgi:hypothetical protein